jgi:hypothetical protein
LLIRQALRPRASSPGQSTLNLRLAMSDVEKSLQEVYSTSSTTHFQTVEATNGRERAPSLSPFPRSPSFHFPPYQTLKVKKPSPQRDSSLPLESLLLPRDLDKYGEIDDTTEPGSEGEIVFCLVVVSLRLLCYLFPTSPSIKCYLRSIFSSYNALIVIAFYTVLSLCFLLCC